MNDSDIEQLRELVPKRRWRSVSTIVERYTRRRIEGSHFSDLRPLLQVKEYSIYKDVMSIVAKMRNPPDEAFDAVLHAWQATWLGDCPQCTDYALKALLNLDRNDPRIISEIERCLRVDNYQVQKECAHALMKIDSKKARTVLADFESHLPRRYEEKLVVNLIEKIRQHLVSTQQ